MLITAAITGFMLLCTLVMFAKVEAIDYYGIHRILED